MRKYRRQIAKSRMAAAGVGRVNRRMKNWRNVLTGDTGKEFEKAQFALGLRIKQRKEAKKSISKRRIRKVQTA